MRIQSNITVLSKIRIRVPIIENLKINSEHMYTNRSFFLGTILYIEYTSMFLVPNLTILLIALVALWLNLPKGTKSIDTQRYKGFFVFGGFHG